MAGREGALLGHINSIQTLGTIDGPGVRFVVFMQGCNLRCSCCHNPETQRITAKKTCSEALGEGIKLYTAAELADMAERYRSYFGRDGGITLSGGEPLVQAEFCFEVFSECKKRGINTCLDTSGGIWNSSAEKLLSVTDRALLDIKYHTDELYRKYVGCGIDAPLVFLKELNDRGIPVTLRQVTIPTLNDNSQSMEFLKELKHRYSCIDKIELLPFKKICQVKYDNMGIPFPFADMDTPSAETMDALRHILTR